MGFLWHLQPRETKDTNLVSCSIIGKPGSGKTTTINDICAGLNTLYKEQSKIFLRTNDFTLVRQIHEHPYKKAVEDADMVIIFIDDAVDSMHSKDSLGSLAKQNEKFFYKIRHYFNEKFKKKQRTLIIFFATQRFMALANIARASDILCWKICNLREKSEQKMVINIMGIEGYRLIQSLNRAISEDYNPDFLKNTVYRVLGNEPRWLQIEERGSVEWVDLLKTPEEEEIKLSKEQKILILERCRHKQLPQRISKFIVGCGSDLVAEVYNDEI